MSLINDALKRAKLAQQKQAPPPAGMPLRPAERTHPVNAPRPLLLPILAAAMLVLVGGILIVVALSRGLRLKSDEPVAGQSVVESPQTSDVSPASASTTSAVVLPSVPINAGEPVAAATRAVGAVEGSNSVPVVPAPREPQLPRLQGILFNPARPTAFLNGKSVVVGGRVGEYTVVAITKQAVTVERAGQTNVLTMEE
jgi:hypothetical protein